MGQSLAIPRVIPEDWKRLDLIINKIKMRLGRTSSPIHVGMTLTGLTASSLVGTDADKALESVTIGTGLAYARPTISLSHLGIEALTDPGVDKILFWDDTASACKWLGMGNSIAITDVTIDTIQDIRTAASPTFAGLTITGNSVFGLNSSVFQPTTDSTTFFQVKDAAGAVIGNVDTVNNRWGFGIAAPAYDVDIYTSSANTRAILYIAGNNQAGAFIANDTRTTGGGGEAVALLAGTAGSIFSFSDGGFFAIYSESKATVLANPGSTGPAVFKIDPDADVYFGLSTGSRIFLHPTQVATGDIKAGSAIAMDNTGTNKNLNFYPDGSGTPGRYITFAAYNGSAWRSMLEYQHSSGTEPDLLLVKSGGFVGVGESAPETVIELTHATPYFTLHNSTHEDTDGGRESRLNFKGEQSGGEETTLVRIEAGHDGAADDEKGYWDLYTNSGTDGNSPTKRIRVDSTGLTKFYSTDLSNYVSINHDNADAYFKTDYGSFIFQTDEGTNTNSVIYAMGKGTGIGAIGVFDQDDAEALVASCTNGIGLIETTGSSPSILILQNPAHAGVGMFNSAASGETQELSIFGYRAADASRSLQIGVGVDAADTVSFDGLTNYFFDGSVLSSKFKITLIGGYAIALTNKTGAASVAGQLVKADTATDDAVILAAAGDTECFGVFLDAGVADGSEAWVVVSGIADVAFDDNVAAVRGDWVSTGVLAGYAATGTSPAAAPTHFEEIGHCLESVTAGGGGTHILARCNLHFN